MATEFIQENIFDRIAGEIISFFEDLIARIKQRKEELITELKSRREKYAGLSNTQNENLRQLEEMRAKLFQMSQSGDIFKNSFEAIEKQISDFKKKTDTPNLCFDSSSFDFGPKISTLGSIIESQSGPSYSRLIEAWRIFGETLKGREKGKIISPEHLYEDKKYIFACNFKKVSIYQRYRVSNGIELEGLHPLSLVTHWDNCYVTFQGSKGYNTCVSKFNKSNFKLMCTVFETGGSRKRLDYPCGIAISEDNVIVADSTNNRVCLFDFDLYFKREFGTKELRNPICVQVKDELIYVLNSNEWHLQVFNVSGERIRCFLSVKETQLKEPKNFALDSLGNIFITDFGTDTIKIFTPSGTLLHRIGREAPGTEDVSGCYGIVVSSYEVLVACKHLNCIKAFSLE